MIEGLVLLEMYLLLKKNIFFLNTVGLRNEQKLPQIGIPKIQDKSLMNGA